MGCIATARTKTGAVSRLCPIFSASRKFVSSHWRAAIARDVRRFMPCVRELCEIRLERAEGALSQVTFLNRQALHRRPAPARGVVRPLKPPIEPRDLNRPDKTRANHIVGR